MDTMPTVEQNKPENVTGENLSNDRFGFMNSLIGTKLASIIFIAISMALVLGVLFTYWMSNQLDLFNSPLMEKPNNKLVEQEETEEWTTYSDYDYHFQIKYPSAWDYTVENDADGMLRIVSFSKDDSEHAVAVKLYDPNLHESNMVNGLINEKNIYAFKNDLTFNFQLEMASDTEYTQELEDVYFDVFSEMVKTFNYTPPEGGLRSCRATGCSGQICADEDVITDCSYSEEYACYKDAVCERQFTGECGWTMSDELKACLRKAAGVEGIRTETGDNLTEIEPQ